MCVISEVEDADGGDTLMSSRHEASRHEEDSLPYLDVEQLLALVKVLEIKAKIDFCMGVLVSVFTCFSLQKTADGRAKVRGVQTGDDNDYLPGRALNSRQSGAATAASTSEASLTDKIKGARIQDLASWQVLCCRANLSDVERLLQVSRCLQSVLAIACPVCLCVACSSEQGFMNEPYSVCMQAAGLVALEASMLLRRAEENSEKAVCAAKQSLADLASCLENGCAENDLEMAAFVAMSLAAFSQDRESATQSLCRVHCRLREAGDMFLEKRLLHALERCYLADDGQEKFARASLTIRNKRQGQYNAAIAEIMASSQHSSIMNWTPKIS